MKIPVVLRQRLIPFETVDISGDELIYRNDEIMVTRWKAIKPRIDISGGISFTFLKKGIKVGRFYDKNRNFLYWYCDIIKIEHILDSDTYILKDLLLDVKVMPNGNIEVLDADELAEALEKELISSDEACQALRTLNSL